MSSTAVPNDPTRRRWLVAVSTAGGAGLLGTSVPFVASMSPSERARALGAPVEAQIGSIKPGDLQTVEWRGKPVWILHRTPEMLEGLRTHDD